MKRAPRVLPATQWPLKSTASCLSWLWPCLLLKEKKKKIDREVDDAPPATANLQDGCLDGSEKAAP